MSEDPIFQDAGCGKWYFWNEVWSDAIGPYESREEAEKELARYVKEYLQ